MEKLSSPPTVILWSSSYDTCMKTRPKLVDHDGGRELVIEKRERYTGEREGSKGKRGAAREREEAMEKLSGAPSPEKMVVGRPRQREKLFIGLVEEEQRERERKFLEGHLSQSNLGLLNFFFF